MPNPEDTDRRVVRFVVDTLVTTDQVELVGRVLARALCGSDDDHAGPCRVAWDIWHLEEGQARRGAALDTSDVVAVRAALCALEVIPPSTATADLLAELEGRWLRAESRSAAWAVAAQGLVRQLAVGSSVEAGEPAVMPEAPTEHDG